MSRRRIRLCRRRSAHYGRSLDHVFTMKITINGTLEQICCSWCGKAQP